MSGEELKAAELARQLLAHLDKCDRTGKFASIGTDHIVQICEAVLHSDEWDGAVERLGEALFVMSASLRESHWIEHPDNHAIYEKVVAAFQALPVAHPLPEQPQEGERYRRALEEIKQATIDGKVCDDVAWFDKFTTLHDFIDMVLDPPEPPVFRDLFPSTETKEGGE